MINVSTVDPYQEQRTRGRPHDRVVVNIKVGIIVTLSRYVNRIAGARGSKATIINALAPAPGIVNQVMADGDIGKSMSAS